MRLTRPDSFSAGRKFMATHGSNGPAELCEFLEVPFTKFGEDDSSGELEIEDSEEEDSEQTARSRAPRAEGLPPGTSAPPSSGREVGVDPANPPETVEPAPGYKCSSAPEGSKPSAVLAVQSG